MRKSSTSSHQASELGINGTQPTGSPPPAHYDSAGGTGDGGAGTEKPANDAPQVMYSELASPVQVRRESDLPTGHEDVRRVVELDTGGSARESGKEGDEEKKAGRRSAGGEEGGNTPQR